MAIGMTYEQYWFGDVRMTKAFYIAHKLRLRMLNEQAWLNGVYVLKALDATVGNAFRSKGETPTVYPKEPIQTDDELESATQDPKEREELEVLWAKAYMENMVLIGKNWGKKK